MVLKSSYVLFQAAASASACVRLVGLQYTLVHLIDQRSFWSINQSYFPINRVYHVQVILYNCCVSKYVSKTSIYRFIYRIVVYKYTSNALVTLVLTEKQCFQWMPKTTVFNVVSQFVWERVPDDWSGDRECVTAECTALMVGLLLYFCTVGNRNK